MFFFEIFSGFELLIVLLLVDGLELFIVLLFVSDLLFFNFIDLFLEDLFNVDLVEEFFNEFLLFLNFVLFLILLYGFVLFRFLRWLFFDFELFLEKFCLVFFLIYLVCGLDLFSFLILVDCFVSCFKFFLLFKEVLFLDLL